MSHSKLCYRSFVKSSTNAMTWRKKGMKIEDKPIMESAFGTQR